MAATPSRFLDPCPAMTHRLPRPDHVAIAYDTAGSASAPAVVFAHGFGQTRHAWSATAATLAAAGYRTITADGRGHGDSGWNRPDQPYQMQQFVDDLDAVTEIAAAPPVLVGASMGGLLGLASAARSPARYRALVLVDITPRWEADGVARILDFMGAHPDGFSDFEQAADSIAAYLPHRQSRKSPEQLRSLLVPKADGRLRWHWDPRLLNEIARDSERHQAGLADAARQLQLPILLISGGRSDLVSERTAAEFLQLVPHARHVCIADATHMVAGDRNDRFTATIQDFLLAVAPAAEYTGASS